MRKDVKKPNLFILGAPKCGTTSLATWLAEHPNIFMSNPKEPHFFSSDLKNRAVTKPACYYSLFCKASSESQVIGEASTWYLFSKTAIDNIERECPGSRFIVMVRDPVEMAYSLYLHNFRKLIENASSFQEAWNLQDERRKGENIPKYCREPAFLQYYEACSLGSLCERLLCKVSEKRVIFIALEKIKLCPKTEYEKVLSFLKLVGDNRESFPVVNQARECKSKLVHRIIASGSNLKKKLGIQNSFSMTKFNEKRIYEKEKLSSTFLNELESKFKYEKDTLKNILDGTSHD